MKYPQIIKKFLGQGKIEKEEDGTFKLTFEDDVVILNKKKFEEFYEYLRKNGFKLVGHEEEPTLITPSHEIWVCNDEFYGNDFDVKIFYTITLNMQGKEFIIHEITITPK